MKVSLFKCWMSTNQQLCHNRMRIPSSHSLCPIVSRHIGCFANFHKVCEHYQKTVINLNQHDEEIQRQKLEAEADAAAAQFAAHHKGKARAGVFERKRKPICVKWQEIRAKYVLHLMLAFHSWSLNQLIYYQFSSFYKDKPHASTGHWRRLSRAQSVPQWHQPWRLKHINWRNRKQTTHLTPLKTELRKKPWRHHDDGI